MLRLTLYSWAIVMLLAWLMSHREVITHVPVASRVAAGVFLIALIILVVVELGWLGGDKDKTSHM